ncbi:MAG: hypothetical protein F4076_03030 [Acidimicrobiaceae bacterium]|nr:hypothetical protein [Acidimicrobiaceae bacterium]MYE75247.1 hypothetical protein [Acidimicrobiaceae bacterium]MYJ41411.1 hypothetical protein [Acidimicrobiaceae bacterium]
MVKQCYKHIIYLAPKGDYERSVEFLRLRKDTQSALNGSDVWEELREYSKVFNPGEFTRKALLHNLRDNDYGCPISEIRDGFWSNPHKPLLPTGAAELRDAIFDAIAMGDIELVNPEGVVFPVHARNDINLAADNIRIRRATCPTCGIPSRDCEGHPSCAKCGQPPDDCTCETEDTGEVGDSTGQPDDGSSQTAGPTVQVRHWQLTLNINTAVNPDDPDADLVHLLRELSNRLEEGNIAHINQTTQITVTGEQEDADAIEDLAKEAGTAVNVLQL